MEKEVDRNEEEERKNAAGESVGESAAENLSKESDSEDGEEAGVSDVANFKAKEAALQKKIEEVVQGKLREGEDIIHDFNLFHLFA